MHSPAVARPNSARLWNSVLPRSNFTLMVRRVSVACRTAMFVASAPLGGGAGVSIVYVPCTRFAEPCTLVIAACSLAR